MIEAADLLSLITLRDVIDILLVTVVIYNLLLLIRGTRAVQVLLGLMLVGALYYLSRFARLPTLETLLGSLLIALPFAIIVLFQQEIRRALASFGSNPLFGLAKQEKVASTFQEIAVAASAMSNRRIGALIVIERLEGLRNYIENGIQLDAVLTFDLLMNIFAPDTPLHDGAAIVHDDRIAAAACFLPLSNNPELSKEYGTRHRAAIGITEETHAVAVVVSEESGTISVAHGGEMIRSLDDRTLQSTLYKLLITDLYPQSGGGA